jgi:hypothetical protein
MLSQTTCDQLGVGASLADAQLASTEEKLNTTVGARVDDVGLGGPLWSPAVGRLTMSTSRCIGRLPLATGDHKGTQPIHPIALAPTEASIEA